jgi:hypothetical protein
MTEVEEVFFSNDAKDCRDNLMTLDARAITHLIARRRQRGIWKMRGTPIA